MRAQGFEPSYRLTTVKLVKAPPKIRPWFQDHNDEKVMNINRLRWQMKFRWPSRRLTLPGFVYEAAPRLFVPEVLNIISMYSTLEYQLGSSWCQPRIIVEASQATLAEAELLSIKRGDLVLVIARLTRAENDRPIEFVKLVSGRTATATGWSYPPD